MLRLSNNGKVYPHMSLLCALSDEDIISSLGNMGLKKVREMYKSPEEFIVEVENKILRDAKYKTWITDPNFFQKPKDYIRYFKYITLCIAGEIDPSDWKYQSLWINKKVQSTPKIVFNKSDKNKLHTLLINCIENILGLN